MNTKPGRPHYNEADLLAKCDPSIPFSPEEREWLDMPAVGQEIQGSLDREHTVVRDDDDTDEEYAARCRFFAAALTLARVRT